MPLRNQAVHGRRGAPPPAQTGNQEGFLSLGFGLGHFAEVSDDERLRRYRRFVYEVGSVSTGLNRLRCRTRYFTDRGVIGTRKFVAECYRRFDECFACRHPKRPQPVAGIDGVFSLKRLRKAT